jgi:hypothetical protein
MTATSMRDLIGPSQRTAIRDLLQGVFVSELILPSRRMWLASAWISDIEVIDNTARQFSSLCPDWMARPIRLSEVLCAILERGSEVVVIVREHKHNQDFISRIERLRIRHPGKLFPIIAPSFHEKGILGDGYVLSGSMNFTYSGINTNDEHLIYRCDPAVVEERRLVLVNRWKDVVPC